MIEILKQKKQKN